MKELAERLGITTGTLTVTVDKLEKKGLVARKPHQHDRRSWLISLTESGHRIFRQHDRFHLDFTKDISADLNTQDIETLSKLLSRVLARM